jgi:hypothetical protein
MTVSALLLVVFFLGTGSQGASGQDAKEEAVKKARLNALYKAYQAFEVSNGKPAKKVDDLPLGKEDVKELKRWLNLDELGVSLADSKKEDLAKRVMAYEKEAPKNGGMVMFYDGSIKTLSAADLKKITGKQEEK